MVITYRCGGCGYLHAGEPTDACPMCGAPATAFAEYAAPDLTGTKTAENLKAAFAGESQANRRYTLFRHIAELEGSPTSSLAAFDRAAREETAHALSHLAYLGGFGTTSENLASAANGEDHERSTMYPEFAETAEAEGLSELASYFRALARFEGQHNAEYLAAKKEIDG